MEVQVITPSVNTVSVVESDIVEVEVNSNPVTVVVSAGYLGQLSKTLLAGENIEFDETDNDITINSPTQPVERLLKTSNHTLILSDAYKLIDMNVAGDNTVTVPPNASVAFDIGTTILVSQYGVGQTEILAGSGVTIRSESDFTKLSAQYTGAVLVKIGTNEWYLQGALSA